MNWKPLIKKAYRIFRNKYVLSMLFFIIWLLIFDRNNLVDRFRVMHRIRELEREKEYYLEKIGEDSRRLKELRTDKDNLEKSAREEYLMKKPDEDIFIVVE